MARENSKKYWQKRSEQRMINIFDDAERTITKLNKYYLEANRSIEKDINRLYAQFAAENGLSREKATEIIHGAEYLEWRMTMEEYLERINLTKSHRLLLELNALTMRARITRLEALNAEIKANISILAENTEITAREALISGLEKNYYKNMYDEYKDRNSKVYELMESHNVGLSMDEIDKILSLPWSGANYSENIWENAERVADEIQRMVARNVMAGKSVRNLSTELMEITGKSRRATERIIRTELAYVKGQADLRTYEDLEIEEYEILATLDSRTSKICQNQDGAYYPLDKAVVGENYPPFHPNCRTTTIKYNPGRQWSSRIARDAKGRNVTVPMDMKYKEWERWVKS